MIHHSHHIQVPPPHQHHVIVSVKNYRKEVLNCSKTKVGRKCIAIIIPLAVLLAILYFGLKFLSGPGDLGQTLSGANDFSPYTSIMFPVSGLYCDSYSMTKYSGSPVATLSWNASMYILKDIPKLSTRHNFSVHREDQDVITLKPGEFYQWSFILHIGSSDMPSLCKRQKSDSNAAADTEQPVSPRCNRKVLIALLWFLIVLLIALISVCAILFVLTLILGVVSYIFGGIPGFTSNKLKLGLLAVSTILFVVSILCNKLKQWIQDKLHALTEMMHLSQNGQNHQTSNTNDTNSTASRSDIKDHLRNQILKLFCIFLWLPIVIICVASIAAAFTFLEALFPVLVTYSFEIDPSIFTPGDTQTFSFNSFFCSGYSISSYGSSHLSASLYIANSESVVGNHSITYINSNESVRSSVNATWNFYLNKKSSARMKACLFESDPTENTTLDLYEYDTIDTNLLHTYDISDSCDGDLLPLPIGKRSGKAGNFILVLSTESTYSVNVHVEIELNHFVYSVDHVISSAQTCSVSSHTSDTCTAIAPGSAGSMTGLISVYSDQSTIDWHETLSITKTCHYHMATWTALWLPLLLINVVIFSIVYGAIHMAKFKQLQKKPSQGEAIESDTESLINHNTNGNNYGTTEDVAHATVTTDTLDPAGGQSADAGQASDSDPDTEPEHVVIGVEIEHPSNDTIGSSDLMATEAETEHPSGDINIGPTSESDPTAVDSAMKIDKSFADASIRSTSD